MNLGYMKSRWKLYMNVYNCIHEIKLETSNFKLKKIYVMAWIVKLYQIFPAFLVHSSYCSFFKTFLPFSYRCKTHHIDFAHKVHKLGCHMCPLYCLIWPQNISMWECWIVVVWRNFVCKREKKLTLTPSIMEWRSSQFSMFASSIQLVTCTCLDLFFAWTSMMYGNQAWSMRFPSHTWNIFPIRWCKEGLDCKNCSNSSLTTFQWSFQLFVLSGVTSTMHPSIPSKQT